MGKIGDVYVCACVFRTSNRYLYPSTSNTHTPVSMLSLRPCLRFGVFASPLWSTSLAMLFFFSSGTFSILFGGFGLFPFSFFFLVLRVFSISMYVCVWVAGARILGLSYPVPTVMPWYCIVYYSLYTITHLCRRFVTTELVSL